MKKKHNQCYLLLGTVVMILVACLCSFVFVKGNLEQAARKDSFESIYTNTTIDYIVPGPSDSQIEELETTDGNGIAVITPYYETATRVTINGKPVDGTSIIFPFEDKMKYTPYGTARVTSGTAEVKGGDAIADQAYIDKFGCSIGDEVSLSVAGHDYSFTITSIAETNTYYNNGTLALILTEDDARQFADEGIKYSAAYISASDVPACEAYLYSEYKPLSRLKDRDEFDSEDTYNQHVKNFNEADWSKEVTNCQENYRMLSVKYDNVQSGIWTNIAIMSAIVALTIIVFNTILLKKESMKSFMKSFLVKKSGTKDAIKSFYRSGIIENAVVFCVVSAGLYYLLATQTHTRLIGLQVLNCIIPILVAIVFSIIMIAVSGSYVENHYRVKVVQKKDSTEEVQVEVV